MAGHSAHLCVYRFDPGAPFEGALAGAIERMELDQGTRLLDALFVRREAESGALEAMDLAAGTKDGTSIAMLDFRLDPGRREAISKRTLAKHGGESGSLMEAIGTALEPGDAMLAVLHTGDAQAALEDAVARCQGRVVADERVDARRLMHIGRSHFGV